MNEIPLESTITAHSPESNGHAPKKTPPSAISNHLRDELIRILTTGDDKNDGAFTVVVATQVEKFAVAAREILMTESLAKNDLSSLMMMRRQHMGGSLGGSLMTSGWNNFIGDSSGLGGVLPYPNQISNNENFGVQAIRQIVDAIRTIGESPAKLVEALAAARENKLTDVVAALEKKLGISKEEPAHEGDPHAGGAS
jgi:hypothetical protein